MSVEKREAVREKLRRFYLTNVWLINQLEKQNIDVCSSTLSSILNGSRKGPIADKIIDTSLSILEEYEQKANLT